MNCHVAFDNFFSTYSLLEELHRWEIFATYTVRANRKYLPLFARKKEKWTNEITIGEQENIRVTYNGWIQNLSL